MQHSSEFSWKTSRILIADDEPDMREIFAAWFRNLGCSVTEAADGKEALEILARDRFDAIVTDVRMPRIDGIQLVHHLHQSGSYTPVVIFVSGFTDLALPDAFDFGVEAVLSKPCERADLIAAVERSLWRRELVFLPVASVVPPDSENCLRESFPGEPSAFRVALGRGGMSLDVHSRPSLGSAIAFALTFAAGTVTDLRGWGLIRWANSLPEGARLGIEFFSLHDESRKQLARWLAECTPVSFIPKDCQLQSARTG
jgi:CheY-like chemotaxis protein